MRRSLVVGTVVATAVLVPATALVDAGPGGRRAAASELPAFDDCSEALAWFKKHALQRLGPWGLEPLYAGAVADAALTAGGSEARAQSAAPDAATGSNGAGTNVQEAGVDEGDLVKTDGRYVYTVRGDVLSVVDTTGAPRRVDRVQLEHWGTELLLDEGRLVVVGPNDAHGAYPTDGRLGMPSGSWMYDGWSTRTGITTLDVSDPDDVRPLAVQEVDGRPLSVRLHDGIARVVLAADPSLRFSHQDIESPPGDATESRRVAAHEQTVRESDIEDWLPGVVRRDGDGGLLERSPLIDCSDLRRPTQFSGLTTIAVVTMDLRRGGPVTTTGVVAGGETVYAAERTLYVASTDWAQQTDRRSGRARPEPRIRTKLHAFALEGATTSYAASGTVDGVVPGRWALSEHNGLLRVAATLGTMWGANGTETVVNVLRRDGDRLQRVGHVGGMGKGEGVKAVRWFGDLGVVVTFRQTDPLYTIDLSDPTGPRVTGELKIPGYSGYLHPVGDGLLLGVGADADVKTGQRTGAQVSLFDLTDLSDPRRVAQVDLGRGELLAEHDSRAFTYLPDQRTALIPATDWRGWQVHAVTVDKEAAGPRLRIETAVEAPRNGMRATPVGGLLALVGDRELRLVDPAAAFGAAGVAEID